MKLILRESPTKFDSYMDFYSVIEATYIDRVSDIFISHHCTKGPVPFGAFGVIANR